MKSTFELPDDLLRSAKVAAAAQGRPLKDVIADALREMLGRTAAHHSPPEPPWMRFFELSASRPPPAPATNAFWRP